MRGQERVVVVLVSLLLVPLVSFAQAPARRLPQQAPTVVPLPAPTTEGSVDINAALDGILSRPAPSDQPLTLEEVGQLAWAAQGRPAPAEPNAPADERALLKIHFALPDGLYLYIPSNHSLRQTRNIDIRASLVAGLLKQRNGPVGGCQIIISGTSKDFTAPYGDRARDALFLLAGRVVQRIQLEAIASNLTFVGIHNANAATVTKICGLGKGIEPLYILLVGPPAGVLPRPKIVVIVVPDGFQDDEYFGTRRLLEMNSVQVLVAGARAGPIRSRNGATAVADLSVDRLPFRIDALVFVGGADLQGLLNSLPLAGQLQSLARSGRTIIAASGNAPALVVSVHRGVIAAKYIRVTSTPEIAPLLLLNGAQYTGRAVERSEWLITSVGPQAVPLFVQAILEAMAGQ